MIYNSLFKKDYDKRIIMKKYIENRRQEKIQEFSIKSPRKRRRKETMAPEDSSKVINPFIKKDNIESRQWGIIKDPRSQMNSDDLKKNEVIQKFSLLKQELKTLRNSLKANDVGEFKKQIG